MKNLIKNLFTEPDNSTFCPVRLIAVAGALQYLFITGAAYWQHATFDPQGFSIGFGALLGGIGVALGLKKDTPKEP